jgi:hypothetical protein
VILRSSVVSDAAKNHVETLSFHICTYLDISPDIALIFGIILILRL